MYMIYILATFPAYLGASIIRNKTVIDIQKTSAQCHAHISGEAVYADHFSGTHVFESSTHDQNGR